MKSAKIGINYITAYFTLQFLSLYICNIAGITWLSISALPMTSAKCFIFYIKETLTSVAESFNN